MSSAGIPATYRFGRFQLDARTKALYLNGDLIGLPAKAIEILTVLVQNAGELVAKEQIMQTVWPDTFVCESSLAKNIFLLRKALASGSGNSWIQTASKRGYLFSGPVTLDSPEKSVNEIPYAAGPQRRIPRWTNWRLFAAVIVLIFGTIASQHTTRRISPPGDGARREYLMGQYLGNKFEPAQAQKAALHFRTAAGINSQFAAAHAGLARSYVMMTFLGQGSPKANLSNARREAYEAIRLDPRSADPHVSLGFVHLLADFDPARSEREFREAIRVEPDSAYAHAGYADLLSHAGRTDEARRQIRHARWLDPASPFFGVEEARIEYFARNYEGAIALLLDVLDRDPSFSLSHYYLALALGEVRRTTEALNHLHKARLNPSMLESDEAWLQSIAGNPEPARRLVAKRMGEVKAGSAKSTVLLIPAVAAGQYSLALHAIREMWKTREAELFELKVGPRLDPLRRTSEFQEVADLVW